MKGLDYILNAAWNTVKNNFKELDNDANTNTNTNTKHVDEKVKLQALSLAKECYAMRLDLISKYYYN